ncbi:hypothetical protein [Paenibacillus sp. B-A-8]|uniref:hypothetical protein n=1 Tax=Paenibacillus sp. B-A-8 TaxID=3400419 RepID=UPI003B02671E
MKLNGIEAPYVLKFSLNQAGVARSIQLPALKKDNQFEIKTTRVAVGETSVRIALAVKGTAGAYKVDAKGKVVKNYNKQLEIKIPLKK